MHKLDSKIIVESGQKSRYFASIKHYFMVKKMYPKPELVPATIEDYPTIQNMARFYVYDMSRFCGDLPDWECPEDGHYECFDLKPYFEEDDRYPFLVRIGKELAGFVLINKYGTTEDVDWNVAEFFILAKVQGKGIGEQVAIDVCNQFKGILESSVIPQNYGDIEFWQKTITKFTHGDFAKTNFTKTIKPVTYPKPHKMVMWRFES